ncbi:MAG: peptidoglycan DD-metalloendopeptidase family protein [Gammaproteobacteria bacterium]|nr:peptidoglycan DD-metalloendopeptidase family protein [Gammaproteobacteria bacterium]
MLIALALATGLLTSCSGNSKYWDPNDYTVKSGDTLYSIAWRYELDIEDFAAWNNLGSSTFIKAGQRLHTRKPANFDDTRSIAYSPEASSEQSSADRYVNNQRAVRAKEGDTLYGLSRRYGVDMKYLAQLNQLKKPYVIQPGQTIFLQPLNTTRPTTTATRSVKKHTPKPVTKTRSSSNSWPTTVRWQRPANGRVVKQFSSRRNDAKGIDIAGKEGSAILAAADGTVVYSGNGLISYGNLIIIKHNKIFLSAYAYNRKLLVKEGDEVKAGRQIAEMGHKDKTGSRLHFEIRKNGKPVDPLKYLPW